MADSSVSMERGVQEKYVATARAQIVKHIVLITLHKNLNLPPLKLERIKAQLEQKQQER